MQSSDLTQVKSVLLAMISKTRDREPTRFFARVIREAIDQVLDGGRTGRWSEAELAPQEKAYIGSRVEWLLKSELDIGSGMQLDLRFADIECDVKWAQSHAGWMIGPQQVGSAILGICKTRKDGDSFSVGLFIADEKFLRPGSNQDGKRQLAGAAAVDAVDWIVAERPLIPGFLESLPKATRQAVFAGKTAQDRVASLLRLVPKVPIPRVAFETVARTTDPARRLRRDKYNAGGLAGIEAIFTNGERNRARLAKLGLKDLPANHWVGIPL